MTPERVDWHLWNWEQWQRHEGTFGDYESRASGGVGGTGSKDFDAMVATADARCALAVDVIIGGLPPIQRMAVHNVHLSTVFRFRDEGAQAAMYVLACKTIGRGLDIRGIV